MALIQKKLEVPPDLHGQRADKAIALMLPEYSRGRITTWLKGGSILIDGKQKKPSEELKVGEIICINVDEIEIKEQIFQPEVIPLDIVYVDEHILVINKPAGLVVHPGAGNKTGTLQNALLHYDSSLANIPRAGLIHRIDKDTTGLLIVARTLSAHNALVLQMQAREIKRQYKALVYGHIIAGSTISTHYGRDPKNRLKMAVLNTGKEAITHFTVCEHFGEFTLCDVQLDTGRTHQIRVHMAYIKHPLVGDLLYSSRKKPKNASAELLESLTNFKRQALHAWKISFIHPNTEDEIKLNVPIPDDMENLITQIRENYG